MLIWGDEAEKKKMMASLIKMRIIDVWKKERAERITEKKKLEQEIRDLEAKQKRVEELVIDGTFDKKTYRRKTNENEIDEMIIVKLIEMNEYKLDADERENMMNYTNFSWQTSLNCG